MNENTATLTAPVGKVIHGQNGRTSYMLDGKFVSKANYESVFPVVIEVAPVSEVVSENILPVDNSTAPVNAPAFKLVGGMSVGDRLGKRLEDGSFETALGHKATRGHRHVAAVWGDKQPLLTDFQATIAADAENKQDIIIPLKDLVVTDDLRITGTGNYLGLADETALVNVVSTPTATRNLVSRMFAEPAKDEDTDSGEAVYGIGSRLGMDSARWMIEHGFSADLAKYINIGLAETLENQKREKAKEKGLLLRTRQNADGDYIADAICSEKYGIIDNDEVLSLIANEFPTEHRNGLLASHASYDGRDMVMNILVPDLAKDMPDSEYGVGISVRNSEVGHYTLRISAFLFRAICMNGCIWDRKESEVKINKKHLGVIDFAKLKEDIAKVIRMGLSEGTQLLDQFTLAHEIVVPSPMQTIAFLGKSNKLTTSETRAWYQSHTDNGYDATAFGIVNALTEAAQKYQGVNRADLETTAARILTTSLLADIDAIGKRWEGYQTQTANAWKDEAKSMRQYVGVQA